MPPALPKQPLVGTEKGDKQLLSGVGAWLSFSTPQGPLADGPRNDIYTAEGLFYTLLAAPSKNP